LTYRDTLVTLSDHLFFRTDAVKAADAKLCNFDVRLNRLGRLGLVFSSQSLGNLFHSMPQADTRQREVAGSRNDSRAISVRGHSGQGAIAEFLARKWQDEAVVFEF
jgi:hypothetical protein